MSRYQSHLTLALLASVGICVGASGCGPEDNTGRCGGEFFPSCAVDVDGEFVNCCSIDPCTANVEARAACCACDPYLYCVPDVPCDLDTEPLPEVAGSTCMACHNGSNFDNYAGDGVLNPHPFPGARFIACETCHGGDPTAEDPERAHIPRPIEIGARLELFGDPQGYEYYRTLAGVETLSPYQIDGQTFEPIDWLQFINPGATAVVEQGRGCASAGCHTEIGAWMATSVMTTGAGISSALLDHSGAENAIPEHVGWYGDTAADYGFRSATDPQFTGPDDDFGRVGSILQLPEKSRIQDVNGIFDNPAHSGPDMADDVIDGSDGTVHSNQLIAGSPLHDVLVASATGACSQCHLGNRGSNRQLGEFRSSGCSACHMRYAPSGRYMGRDPHVEPYEPANPDLLEAPERAHPQSHRIASAAQVLPSGDAVLGIDDQTCATCHQQTNDIALQYWGVRVDSNGDVVDNQQYPSNPNVFQTAANFERLFVPSLQNRTYQGYRAEQLMTFEDYDADGLNDIPADIHYSRGLGCTDCHAGGDLHNGAPDDMQSGALYSRSEQATAIACESCHGGIDDDVATGPCIDFRGDSSQCALDRRGNPLAHVTRDQDGQLWLFSRRDGRRHYVSQTRDVTVDNGAQHPLTGEFIYSARASYAMGRADGDPSTGIGPQQIDTSLVTAGFAHSDRMDCTSCHAAWNNHRMGAYLSARYEGIPPAFSTVNGEPVAVKSDPPQAIYQNPVPLFLGVSNRGQITQTGPQLPLFFQYTNDLNGSASPVFAFSNRRGDGNNPSFDGRGSFGALGHGRVAPHTIRGASDSNSEGARQCVACHLNSEQLDMYGADYQAFVTAVAAGDAANIDYNLLQQHLGQNPGNEENSPFFVHMAAGLGTGMWYFDADGCPVNPLDISLDRATCGGARPASNFDAANVAFALDQLVTPAGVANASGHRPAASAATGADIAALRDGAHNPEMPGPLGATLTRRLADPNTGLILDSWLDASGSPRGQADDFL